MSKTGRIYGAMTGLVLSQQGRFTWKKLCPPLNRKQAEMRCRSLVSTGLLRVIRKAEIGRNNLPALYERNIHHV